jgi:hypothetical protein
LEDERVEVAEADGILFEWFLFSVREVSGKEFVI